MSDTKTITVVCTWTTHHTVEVPADFEVDEGDLDCFPPDVLDQFTAGDPSAELVGWEDIRRR